MNQVLIITNLKWFILRVKRLFHNLNIFIIYLLKKKKKNIYNWLVQTKSAVGR